MMYTIGAMLGYGLKLLIEKTRSVLTLGHDANMLKLYYIDKKTKNKNSRPMERITLVGEFYSGESFTLMQVSLILI